MSRELILGSYRKVLFRTVLFLCSLMWWRDNNKKANGKRRCARRPRKTAMEDFAKNVSHLTEDYYYPGNTWLVSDHKSPLYDDILVANGPLAIWHYCSSTTYFHHRVSPHCLGGRPYYPRWTYEIFFFCQYAVKILGS